MKKVRFNEQVIVYTVPLEDRMGYWTLDACQFKNRIKKVEQAIKGCLIKKHKKYLHNIYDESG